MGRGLSERQEEMIRSVGHRLIADREELDRLDAAEGPDDPRGSRAKLRFWLELQSRFGAAWGPGGAASRRACSRSLRRLEARGLVTRRYGGPRRPTSHVRLTPAGWEVYRQLTGRDVSRMVAEGGDAG